MTEKLQLPKLEYFLLPFLLEISDGKTRKFESVYQGIVERSDLTEEQLEARYSATRKLIIRNRVHWAKTYLKLAGLLEYPKRGHVIITDVGKDYLSKNPEQLTLQKIEEFEAYIEYQKQKKEKTKVTAVAEEGNGELSTPEEQLEAAYEEINSSITSELLSIVKSCSPGFFERLVVKLLLAMGYGGSLRDAGKAIGQSGDGGIDGIIKEDKLGLDSVYLQAKRWDSKTVGRPDIQQFVGALGGVQAQKGVFITTSTFSKEAISYAEKVSMKIILIDGQQLADYLVEYNVGVSTDRVYEIKNIDQDFFDE